MIWMGAKDPLIETLRSVDSTYSSTTNWPAAQHLWEVVPDDLMDRRPCQPFTAGP